MKRSRTQAVRAVFGAAIALSIPVLANSAAASPIDQQRDRVAYYTDGLERLEEQAAIYAEDLDEAIHELSELEADVAEAEAEVTAQEAKVAETQQLLSDTVVRDFVGADPGSIGPLFADASAINDQIRREQFSAAALNAGAVTSDDLNRELNDLNDKKAELAAAQEEAEAKRAEVESAKEAAESKAEEYRDLKADAEAELGEMIEAEERRRAEESYQRMLAQQRAAAAANNQQATQSGGGNSQSGGGASQSGGGNSQSGGGNSESSGGGSSQSGGGASSTPNIPPASSKGQRAVNAAMTQIGVSYKYATASPGVSFDCSGLTSWAWSQAGVSITRQSRAQYAETARVPASEAQPGDLLFFYSPISHVAMYIGGGQMIHAPNSGSYVHTRAVNWGNVVGVGRPG